MNTTTYAVEVYCRWNNELETVYAVSGDQAKAERKAKRMTDSCYIAYAVEVRGDFAAKVLEAKNTARLLGMYAERADNLGEKGTETKAENLCTKLIKMNNEIALERIMGMAY